MRRVFRLLAHGDVSDDRDAARDVVVFVAQWRVVALEDSGARWSVRMIFGNYFPTFERGRKTIPTDRFTQERKDVDNLFAQDFFAAQARNALHGAIPGNQATVAIKREDTIDAGVDKSSEQECGVCIQNSRAASSICVIGAYFAAVRSISPV